MRENKQITSCVTGCFSGVWDSTWQYQVVPVILAFIFRNYSHRRSHRTNNTYSVSRCGHVFLVCPGCWQIPQSLPLLGPAPELRSAFLAAAAAFFAASARTFSTRSWTESTLFRTCVTTQTWRVGVAGCHHQSRMISNQTCAVTNLARLDQIRVQTDSFRLPWALHV